VGGIDGAMHARDLDGQSRSELISRAELFGVEKASLLTRAELVDEIVRRAVSDPIERRLARGLLGLARDLVASVVERGLHLPDAAAKIRAIPVKPAPSLVKPPIATVTLAEIYAAQGHRKKALRVLDEVLTKEPDHTAARQLHDSIASSGPDEPVLPPETDEGSIAPRRDDVPAPAVASERPVETAESPVETAGPAAETAEPATAKIEAAPSPADLYESDEIVLLPVDAVTVFVYWETREATLARLRQQTPGGALVVRIVAVSPSWHGPILETRDLETDLRVGEWFVRDLPYGAVLRAALGWREADQFEPLCVAMRVSELPAVLGRQPVGDVESPAGNDVAAPASERARERVYRAAASQGSASWVALPSVPAPAFHVPVQDFAATADAG
jgi:hypothetical protein